MSINEIELPKYSLAEELWNAISHGLGAIFGIVALILMLIKVIPTSDPFSIIAVLVYGISLIILFTISCVYHSLAKNKGKKVMRIMDHNMIFLSIASSYTPYTLIALRNENVWGWRTGVVSYIMLSTVWACCILGIVFNSINIKKYAWLSMICYLFSGWIVVSAIVALWNVIGSVGTILLILSGVSYSLGCIVYGLGKKIKYMHTIFHFFVLIGAILMFISIYCFVL